MSDESEFEYECTRGDCDRRFRSRNGLLIHIARSHPTEGEDPKMHEADAVEAAERQPVEEEEAAAEVGEDVEGFFMEGRIRLDQEEFDLVQAVSFLYGYVDDEDVLCAAMVDFFDWARVDPDVKNAIELKRRAAKKAKS